MESTLTIAGLAFTIALFAGAAALWAQWGEAAFLSAAPIFCL